MQRNSVWSWVVYALVAIVVIWGVIWVFGIGRTSSITSTTASSTDMTASTTVPSTSTTLGGYVNAGQPIAIQNRSNETVAQIVAELGGASEFQSLFNSTGVGATLIGTAPSSYTVFVSTNQGYGLLPPGTMRNMTGVQLKRMVQYSVVSGRALAIDAVQSGNIQTLSGDTVNFHVGTTGLVQVNSSYALAAYKGKNGIVYVVNQPLLPPVK